MSTIISPGQLVSEVPGILGFVPEESLILICLEAISEERHSVGPVIRVDLDEDEQAFRDVAEMAAPADIVFAILVAETLPVLPEPVRELPSLACAWYVPRIEEGERITMVATGPLDAGDRSWHAGVVPPIHQSTSLRDLISHGGLLALSRDEAVERLQLGPDAVTYEEAIDHDLHAALHAQAIEHGRMSGAYAYAMAVTHAGAALERHLTACETGDATSLADAVGLAATLLRDSDLHTRDIALGVLLTHPRGGLELATLVARSVSTPDVRANALAAAAVCAVALGTPQMAPAALTEALRTSPGHSLSQLLYGAACAGAYDHMLEAVRRGTEVARDNLAAAA